MNKAILFFSVGAIACMASCSSKTENANQEEYSTPATSEVTATVDNSLIGQGAALVKKNDCNTCHHVTSTIVGPSYTEVAKKYDFTTAEITAVADRIIKGSSGIWGQIMMTPHPGLAQADAEKMARYVLSLDGEKEPD